MRKAFNTALRILLLLAGIIVSTHAPAHESPDHSVADLSHHMEQDGVSVPLLLQRAAHYRVLGKTELAVADLLLVLELEPNQRGALVELSRIELTREHHVTALRWINRAIAATTQKNDNNAHLFAARGDVLIAQGDYRSALEDYARAIAMDKTEVDWYLQQSRLHQLLKLPHDRIAALDQGYKIIRSAVLHTEWVDALIEGGKAEEALLQIEPQLEQSRLKSSWLLRRARALLASKRSTENSSRAHHDLEAAIAEINIRLRPTRPDLDLLLDRAQAHLLLGDVEYARKDFQSAKDHGAAPRQLERFQRQLQTTDPAANGNR